MSRISVTIINGNGFVFNAADYMKIRSEYRILGNLVGFNAVHPSNGNLKGLPAIFNKYELQLLYENNWIVPHDKHKLKDPPSFELINSYKEFRRKNFNEQRIVQRMKKLEERRQHLDKILKSKENALLKENPNTDISTLNPEQILEEEVSRTFQFTEQNELIQISHQHFVDVEENIINFASDTSIKYRVFKDLWQRGKFLTSGESFGGDFLVYPGDPMVFHASHIVHIVENKMMPFTLLAAQVRLSVVVNKFCVLAYVNGNKDICYQTVEWQGNFDTRDGHDQAAKTSQSLLS